MTDCVALKLQELFDDMNRDGVVDIRKPPDGPRKGQFMQGWKDSMAGHTRGSRSLEKLTWNNLGWRAGEATKVCAGVDPERTHDHLVDGYRSGELRLKKRQWEARSAEDHLLQRYWDEQGGDIFVEVPVGGEHSGNRWHGKGGLRRLDGLRIEKEGGAIRLPDEDAIGRALRDQSGANIEVIEVKKTLNRTVIGQTQAGRYLLCARYGLDRDQVREVVVCAKGDAALEWVCKQLNIFVWTLNEGPTDCR